MEDSVPSILRGSLLLPVFPLYLPIFLLGLYSNLLFITGVDWGTYLRRLLLLTPLSAHHLTNHGICGHRMVSVVDYPALLLPLLNG